MPDIMESASDPEENIPSSKRNNAYHSPAKLVHQDSQRREERFNQDMQLHAKGAKSYVPYNTSIDYPHSAIPKADRKTSERSAHPDRGRSSWRPDPRHVEEPSTVDRDRSPVRSASPRHGSLQSNNHLKPSSQDRDNSIQSRHADKRSSLRSAHSDKSSERSVHPDRSSVRSTHSDRRNSVRSSDVRSRSPVSMLESLDEEPSLKDLERSPVRSSSPRHGSAQAGHGQPLSRDSDGGSIQNKHREKRSSMRSTDLHHGSPVGHGGMVEGRVEEPSSRDRDSSIRSSSLRRGSEQASHNVKPSTKDTDLSSTQSKHPDKRKLDQSAHPDRSSVRSSDPRHSSPVAHKGMLEEPSSKDRDRSTIRSSSPRHGSSQASHGVKPPSKDTERVSVPSSSTRHGNSPTSQPRSKRDSVSDRQPDSHGKNLDVRVKSHKDMAKH